MVTTAYADPVAGLFNVGSSTLLSDNSADLIINGVGNDPTIVDPGDILVTIVGITTIEGTSNQTIGSGTVYNELTAILAIKIATIGAPFVNLQGLTIAQYTAVPVTAADTALFDWATGKILGGAYTFTTQAGLSNNGVRFGILYEDSAKNYTRDGGIQTGLTNATDGVFRLGLGLVAANSDYLTVLAPVSLVQLAAFTAAHPSTNINLTNISLDASIIAQNWPGLNFNNNFTGGNGGFSSPSTASGWPAFDNIDFTVTAVPYCGDGVVGNTPGESCDPPGSVPNPTYPANICRESCTYCGDGIVNNGEQCDFNAPGAPANCNTACTLTPICGDGIVGNTPGESCDPPGSVPNPTYPANICRESCTYCGDGIVNNGEQCDFNAPGAPANCTTDCNLELFGGCRMTGGNNTVYPDGTVVWEEGTYAQMVQVQKTGSTKKGLATSTEFKYTVGGQIGAPAAGCCTPGVDCAPGQGGYGEWEHSHHENGVLKFSFHAGTHSAPKDSYIHCITCADPGWCVQARCAPFKQIFWEGTGIFQNPNKKNPDASFTVGGFTVQPYSKAGDTRYTLHNYRAHVGDFGEPGNVCSDPTNPSTCKQKDYNPAYCKWTSCGVDPEYTLANPDLCLMLAVDDPKFGDKGGQFCSPCNDPDPRKCGCPDRYEIEIYATEDPSSAVIYRATGWITGGNHQIHPEVGQQCPY